MKSVTRYRRSGFTGIELLVVLIVLVLIVWACSPKPANPTASDGQRAVTASTAQAVKESAQAGRAVIGIAQAVGDDGTGIVAPAADPVDPPPPVDPPADVTPPDVDLGLDFLDGLFDGF
jgi:type II secretory pathway pseudopilin PulG